MLNGLLTHVYLAAGNACGTKTGILPSLYDGIGCATVDGTQTPTISSMQDILLVVANVVRILIAVAGSLAIIMILVASAYYIISAGDPGRAKKAKDIIISTVIGLVLIIASYAIVTFISGGF